jgi:hypothetical protein
MSSLVANSPWTHILLRISWILWFVAVDATGSTKYLVLSIPKDKQVGYFQVPDTIFRVLVQGGDQGPASPTAIAIDQENSRLFVSDVPTQKIWWYQLIVLPDGKLVTDGRQHVAVEGVESKWLAVDGVGNLYFSGKPLPPPPLPPVQEGIYKHDAIALATGVAINSKEIWARSNSGSPNPKVWAPTGLATDNFHLFWANGQNGKSHGSLVKAPATPPDVQPELSVKAIADNSEEVTSVVLTPTTVFYATKDGIYGVAKSKADAACTEANCALLSDTLKSPAGMVWDGDGTVYVAEADHAKGGIYAFPSNGPLGSHHMAKYVDAAGVYDLDMLEVVAGTVGLSIKVVYTVLLYILASYFL